MAAAAGGGRDAVEVGVTYWPAGVGPYLWHEFDAATVRRDFAAIAARRFRVVRVLLSWDAFMPTDRAPSPRRMRDLETLLATARDLGIGVLPTLFAQSLGDSVMLPRYAVDRRAPRRGVRCVTDGRAVDGGPRDQYADPLMLEVEVRWLDAVLAAFASHPAVVAWDLGYDPATTIRPRRIAHVTAWASLLAGRVHAQEDSCRLTLSQDDVTRGRAVRLGELATHVDALGLLLRPQLLPLPGDGLDAVRAGGVVAIAQALAGPQVPLVVDAGLASSDDSADAIAGESAAPVDTVTAPEAPVSAAADELLQRLLDQGVAGLHAAAAADWGPRTAVAPPADRAPWWRHLGLASADGEDKELAAAWRGVLQREHDRRPPVAHPPALDAAEYYANLPGSLLDVHAAWRDDPRDPPVILR